MAYARLRMLRSNVDLRSQRASGTKLFWRVLGALENSSPYFFCIRVRVASLSTPRVAKASNLDLNGYAFEPKRPMASNDPLGCLGPYSDR